MVSSKRASNYDLASLAEDVDAKFEMKQKRTKGDWFWIVLYILPTILLGIMVIAIVFLAAPVLSLELNSTNLLLVISLTALVISFGEGVEKARSPLTEEERELAIIQRNLEAIREDKQIPDSTDLILRALIKMKLAQPKASVRDAIDNLELDAKYLVGWLYGLRSWNNSMSSS